MYNLLKIQKWGGTMSNNENVEYEKLAKEIYEALHQSEGIKTIDIKHNVNIEGKSGCKHQIDVYWEFEMVGEKHRVAIECKNYTNRVSIGKIRDFNSVLSDIGNIKGIFVTKVGYQSGAVKFAESCEISLKELRFPNEEDWDGRVKDIVMELTAYSKVIKDTRIGIDSEWINKNTEYKESDKLKFSGRSNELLIIDENDEEITNVNKLINELPFKFEEVMNLEKKYEFENAYIYDNSNIKLKIKNIIFVYDIVSQSTRTVSEGEEIAKAILKDISTKDIKFFDKDGNIK